MRPVIRWLFVSLALIASTSQASLLDSLSSGQKTFLPVEEAFPLSVTVTPGQVEARWNNVDGYYLYQHRIYIRQGDLKLPPVSWSKPGKEKYGKNRHHGQNAGRKGQPKTQQKEQTGNRQCRATGKETVR